MIKIVETKKSVILEIKGSVPDLCTELEYVILHLLRKGLPEMMIDVVVNEAKKDYRRGNEYEPI